MTIRSFSCAFEVDLRLGMARVALCAIKPECWRCFWVNESGARADVHMLCPFGLFVVNLRLAIALWCYQLCIQIDIFGVVWMNLHLGEGWCALGHVHLGLTYPSVQCPLCSLRIRLRKLLDRDLTEVQQFVVYWGVNKRKFCDNPV